MPPASKPKPLTIYDFGRRLVETRDLDPVYVLVYEAMQKFMGPQLFWEWHLAYWLFYHVGTASWICSEKDYWLAMRTAAGSREYPRSSERRHFRGRQATETVEWFAREYPEPGKLFAGYSSPGYSPNGEPFQRVSEYVRRWSRFGPWISFKVADMLDRVGQLRVQFDFDSAMYESPRKSAEEWYERETGYPPAVFGDDPGRWACENLARELGDLDAPPRYERKLGYQEYETILCKYKSHLAGNYPVGKDIAEVKHGLSVFPKSWVALEMAQVAEEHL